MAVILFNLRCISNSFYIKRAFHFFLILLFTFKFHPINASAQQPKLDSLLSVWNNKSKPDSIRVEAYYKYIYEGFLYSNTDSALILAEDLIQFAQKHKYIKASARRYNLYGISSVIKGNYLRALEYFEKSLIIYEENHDKINISLCLTNIGGIYLNQGNHTRSLEYYKKALKIAEQIGNKAGMAASLGNIGIIYIIQENTPRALECYVKTLKINKEIGDERGMASNYGNLGVIYVKQGNNQLALEYYEKALKISEDIDDKQGIAVNLGNIGNIFTRLGNYPRALEYQKKALKIREDIGDKQGIANTLSNIGINFQKQGKYPRALDYCNKGLDIAEKINVLKEQKEACQCLFDSHKAMGSGDKALFYLEKLNMINSSLNAKETAKKLQQMEFAEQVFVDSLANSEKERKVAEEHDKEVQKKNKTRNILIGSGIFLLLLASGLYSRNRYIKKSKDIIESERDRSDNLLLNILPAEIATELKENGEAVARDYEMISILFTDFKEFTQTSEKLGATALVAEINHCFKAFDTICEKYNVEKIKTIGDAYMAAGGLPVPTEDSVKKTVLAALDMQRFIVSRKKIKDAKGEPAFEMRVGIHTGPVVAGIVGLKKFQYDIWGDSVNMASRMESAGEVGKVNISQVTYALIKDQSVFEFESRGKIEAKGKGEVEMYFVSIKN